MEEMLVDLWNSLDALTPEEDGVEQVLRSIADYAKDNGDSREAAACAAQDLARHFHELAALLSV